MTFFDSSRHGAGVRIRQRNDYRPTDVWPGFIDILAQTLLIVLLPWLMIMLLQHNIDQADQTPSAVIDDVLYALGIEANDTSDNRDEALAYVYQATLRAKKRDLDEANLAGRGSSTIAVLQEQIAALNEALLATETKNANNNAILFEGERRVNTALATTAQEIARYRSEFFQELDQALPNNSNFEVQGDRFVFRSDVLFSPGSARLNETGRRQMLILRDVVVDLELWIDNAIPWIIRIDGHTDQQPITTALYPSNWELSVARALAVVRYLEDSGVTPKRLAATGFSEYHPVKAGDYEQNFRLNRRIEVTLTRR